MFEVLALSCLAAGLTAETPAPACCPQDDLQTPMTRLQERMDNQEKHAQEEQALLKEYISAEQKALGKWETLFPTISGIAVALTAVVSVLVVRKSAKQEAGEIATQTAKESLGKWFAEEFKPILSEVTGRVLQVKEVEQKVDEEATEVESAKRRLREAHRAAGTHPQ
jgi:hypothetical protein